MKENQHEELHSRSRFFKKARSKILSLLAFATLYVVFPFFSAHGENQPGILQDFYSSTSSGIGTDGTKLVSNMGQMLSNPKSADGNDDFYQSILDAVAEDVYVSGVSMISSSVLDGHLVWNAAANSLEVRMSATQGDSHSILVVYDSLGQLVFQSPVVNAGVDMSVDLSDLNADIYVAGVFSNGNITAKIKFQKR